MISVSAIERNFSPLREMVFAKAQKEDGQIGSLSEQERLLYQLYFVFEEDAHKISTVFKINVKNVYKRKETLVLKLTRLVQTFQSR